MEFMIVFKNDFLLDYFFHCCVIGGTKGPYNSGIDKSTNDAINEALNTIQQENAKRGMFEI